MGYSIFYDKQFVKLESTGTYIPMVLGGSSNCYEYRNNGRERRERDWFNFLHITNGKIHETEEQMLANIMAEREAVIERNKKKLEEYSDWDVYDDKHFGYFTALAINGTTRSTTFGQYKGIVSTGCKKALTIAELASENIHIYLYSRDYGDETKSKFKEVFGDTYYFTPKNEEEFLSEVERVTKLIEGTGLPLWVGFTGMYESSPKWLRRKYFPVEKKSEVIDKTNGFYNIRIDNATNFKKFVKRGMQHGRWTDGWVTTNKKQAERKFKKVCEKLEYFSVSTVELIFNNPDGSKELISTEKLKETI